MVKINLDKYLDITNKEKNNRNLNTYIPLYPMLRVIDNKLYVAVMITDENDNVWDINAKVKAEYWSLIDINNDSLLEFNKTQEKDFVIGNLIEKNTESKQKEISKYMVKKTLQYKEYLINDIKKQDLPIEEKLSKALGNKLDIDGEEVDIEEYLISNLDNDIKQKVDELVEMSIQSKYGTITFYYDSLFKQIVDEYKKYGTINKEKIKLCIEIMNIYYDGVIGIDNLFNI